MAEQAETLTETVASPEARPPAERLVAIPNEELENRKAQLTDFLGKEDKTEEKPLNAKSLLRHARQREYEDIAVEQLIRTKKPEEQQAYRQAYDEGDILRKRAQEYEKWSEEMRAKYGDNWEEKVPKDEWYKIAEMTPDEQRAYQKHLAIKVQANAISQTTYEALTKQQTTKDVTAAEADWVLSNQYVDGAIKKAFPHLTDEAIRAIKSDVDYILFDIGETFLFVGELIAHKVKDGKDAALSEDAMVIEYANSYTSKAINLIRRLLTTKRIQDRLKALQNPQQAMMHTMEGQEAVRGDNNEPRILSNTQSTARNRAQQPPAKVAA